MRSRYRRIIRQRRDHTRMMGPRIDGIVEKPVVGQAAADNAAASALYEDIIDGSP